MERNKIGSAFNFVPQSISEDNLKVKNPIIFYSDSYSLLKRPI